MLVPEGGLDPLRVSYRRVSECFRTGVRYHLLDNIQDGKDLVTGVTLTEESECC